jgi:hypothetical protein
MRGGFMDVKRGPKAGAKKIKELKELREPAKKKR